MLCDPQKPSEKKCRLFLYIWPTNGAFTRVYNIILLGLRCCVAAVSLLCRRVVDRWFLRGFWGLLETIGDRGLRSKKVGKNTDNRLRRGAVAQCLSDIVSPTI